MPANVVLFCSVSNQVGVARHVLDLASMLAAAGRLKVVVCPGPGWLPETLIARGLPCLVAGINPNPIGAIKGNLVFYRITRTHAGTERLIAHVHGRLPILCSIIASSLPKAPHLMATIHQFAGVNRGGWLNWRQRLETLVLRRCSSVICVSRALRDEVARRIGPSHTSLVRVIPNWITEDDRPMPRIESPNSNAPFRILSIGRLSHEKGFDILLRGMAMLHQRGDQVICDIIGDGPQREMLQHLVTALGLEGIASISGPATDARSLIERYDAVVIPSRSESFGLVALEAYVAGVPVIASNVPGLNEIVEDNRTGVLFRSEDPNDLSAMVARVAGDPGLRTILVDNARLAVRERYSETAVGPLMLAEYDRVRQLS